MGLYRDRIFPAMYDKAMGGEGLTEHRRRQLAGLSGEVLEIGAGTGLNLPCYPVAVTRLCTVDPNPGMNTRLARRAAASPIEVESHQLAGESLPFDAGRFRFAVSTLSLCSIADPVAAVREIRRVLAPGGRFVFLEHGLHDDPGVQRWQRRLDRLQHWYADCTLLLEPQRVLEEAGFDAIEMDTFLLDGAPSIHRFMYRGTATR
ncbi:putative methyltransferase YcgJ [Planctomycetes bacterium Pla163]|uniref:Putative methyltransferase YcgJ n=1 Tax=Rohdeia mirabilis TaxID=2528008 RepID=A0A518D3E9_9BACT|nr:putative methyltransferase YcgJ [Planctomycetes bacterium Pla163]